MNAIILSAGMGRRMQPMGWGLPKCLLPCAGGTLLDNALNALSRRGVSRVAIVVGYQQEQVQAAAGKHELHIDFVVNESYATTNTLHSLYLAREYLTDGALLFNGDVWFRPPSLEALSAGTAQGEWMGADSECGPAPPSPRPRVAASAGQHFGSCVLVIPRPCGPEEVKVIVDENDRVQAIGKDVDPKTAIGEYIGIARFGPAAGAALARNLETCVTAGYSNQFYEFSLNQILDRHSLRAAFIDRGEAIEIDTPADYAAAQLLW